MRHPARTMHFDTLWEGLQKNKENGLINETKSENGLSLFAYTQECVYSKSWNEFTLMARGLILNPADKRIVATPFPKFFNLGEREESIPDLPFETFEKLDGSLIILFCHDGKWRCATRGSFSSEQAKWSQEWIEQFDLSSLDFSVTYLLEAIYPENRIVVSYNFSGLVLLAGYHEDGYQLSYLELQWFSEDLGWRIAQRHAYSSVSDLLATTKSLPATEEGFVIQFVNGHRLKIKGEEYCRIHRMVSRVTPLAIWEAMEANDNLDAFRQQLPEEFWDDFDSIRYLLSNQISSLMSRLVDQAMELVEKSDKEVGLMLDSFEPEVRRLIFPFRKVGAGLLGSRYRKMVYQIIRPTNNRLDGYSPSSSMNRVQHEVIA